MAFVYKKHLEINKKTFILQRKVNDRIFMGEGQQMGNEHRNMFS